MKMKLMGRKREGHADGDGGDGDVRSLEEEEEGGVGVGVGVLSVRYATLCLSSAVLCHVLCDADVN